MIENYFKGKRKDNGEWVEGFVFEFKSKIYITEMAQTFMTAYYTEESVVDFNMRAYEIKPDTLCQFTGINDVTKWEDLTESEKESFLSNWNYKENRKNEIGDWKGRKIWEFVGGEVINEST